MAETKQGRGPLWALLAVTGLPFVLAMYLFYNPQLLESIGAKNRGQLVQPTVPVPALQMQTLDGGTFDMASLQDNWSLLLVTGSDCDDACLQNLFHLRQIRLAMGEDRYRVKRLVLLTDTRNSDRLATQLEPFEGTRVLSGPLQARQRMLEALQVNGEPTQGRIYTIDPQGRLVLSYPANPPWKDVLKDLQHLLKVVQL
jgi:cytochrome oxidase Cu insertion factor (SCO1/SenC/PrrC family)